ncbi:hypothetical protein K438DRAFT_1777171 [Mycena galopus ATCC 62051]|nr:hypothetical protein K438DRAFT_1777171 [Mycena galopus ATCC 62051]
MSGRGSIPLVSAAAFENQQKMSRSIFDSTLLMRLPSLILLLVQDNFVFSASLMCRVFTMSENDEPTPSDPEQKKLIQSIYTRLSRWVSARGTPVILIGIHLGRNGLLPSNFTSTVHASTRKSFFLSRMKWSDIPGYHRLGTIPSITFSVSPPGGGPSRSSRGKDQAFLAALADAAEPEPTKRKRHCPVAHHPPAMSSTKKRPGQTRAETMRRMEVKIVTPVWLSTEKTYAFNAHKYFYRPVSHQTFDIFVVALYNT